MMPVSDAYDVVVIGAGAGGMTAAAVAAAEGLSVLLIEKTEFVGGTTAWSGGMVWIPVNAKMKQAGMDDSLSDAANYLASTVPETENADLRETFLARGPEAIEYLEANTEVRLQPVKMYPDYYPEKPGATAGGRVLEPVTFDGARLGVNFWAAASAAAGIHLVRRHDGQPARHPAPSQIRALISLDPALDASCFAICAATSSRAQGHDAASGQCAGGAPVRLAACAECRHSVWNQRRTAVGRRRCCSRRRDQGFFRRPADRRAQRRRAGDRRLLA